MCSPGKWRWPGSGARNPCRVGLLVPRQCRASDEPASASDSRLGPVARWPQQQSGYQSGGPPNHARLEGFERSMTEPAEVCARKLIAVALSGQVEMDWQEVRRLAQRPEYGMLSKLEELVS